LSLCNYASGTAGTAGTTDTIVSDSDEGESLQCSTPEHSYLESSASTPCTLYQDTELARIINCDLAMNNLTTSDTADKIWSKLNQRCIEKFGKDHLIKISDVTWACKILPAYSNWNTMEEYYGDINEWISKINNICKSTS